MKISCASISSCIHEGRLRNGHSVTKRCQMNQLPISFAASGNAVTVEYLQKTVTEKV